MMMMIITMIMSDGDNVCIKQLLFIDDDVYY
jgi:hypothetical protein